MLTEDRSRTVPAPAGRRLPSPQPSPLATARVNDRMAVECATGQCQRQPEGAAAASQNHEAAAAVLVELVSDKSTKSAGGYLDDLGPRLTHASLDRGLLLRPLGNVLYFCLRTSSPRPKRPGQSTRSATSSAASTNRSFKHGRVTCRCGDRPRRGTSTVRRCPPGGHPRASSKPTSLACEGRLDEIEAIFV
jgi:hypothetical protein